MTRREVKTDIADDSDDPVRDILRTADNQLVLALLQGDKEANRRLHRDLREYDKDEYVDHDEPFPTDVPAGTEDKLKIMELRMSMGLRPTARGDCPPLPDDVLDLAIEYTVTGNFQKKRQGLRAAT
jgi:hypothetical protein